MRRYAEDVAVRLEYLVRKRNVKHLAYYCFSNELSQLTNGALQNRLTTFQRYHELLYDAFQRHRLPLGLLATDAAMDNMSQAFLDMFLKNVPLNRPGKPEDIANAVAFLCSERAAFITGEILPVAGGFGLPTPMYSSYMGMGAQG